MDDKAMLFGKELYDYLERSLIPMGICYVENGRFRTYLISDGVCRMYHSTREEMFTRLNGPDPFVNIVEKDEMLKAVRAFSVDNEPYDIVFHEYVGPERKLITVHCTGYHEYTKDGILFVGPKNTDLLESDANSHVFCFDLTTCKLLEEEANNARVLTVMQKAFRLALKIWKRNPKFM